MSHESSENAPDPAAANAGVPRPAGALHPGDDGRRVLDLRAPDAARVQRARRSCAINLLWSIVILLAANVAIAAMLLVRRRAPEGSRFRDGDRASGVFGVLAGGFAIFAGFIIFLVSRATTSRGPAEKPKHSPFCSSSRPPSSYLRRCTTG
jgi:hypothetical protein